MLYAIFCYDSEAAIGTLSREQDEALISKLAVVQQSFAAQGRLGPVVRLMPTTSAITVRRGAEPLILDGPFAETKEQLLGFYILECATLEDAIDAARQLAREHRSGAYEIRPVRTFAANAGDTMA